MEDERKSEPMNGREVKKNGGQGSVGDIGEKMKEITEGWSFFQVLLISVLKEPVLRTIYDFVIRSPLINDFFHV